MPTPKIPHRSKPAKRTSLMLSRCSGETGSKIDDASHSPSNGCHDHRSPSKSTHDDTVEVLSVTTFGRSDLSNVSLQSIEEVARKFHVTWKVKAGGVLLAFCAGLVNSIAFFYISTFVSHQTGHLSNVGLHLQGRRWSPATSSLGMVLSFVSGSMVCGFLIANNTIHFGLALYDFCLLGVAALLVATAFLEDQNIAQYLAVGACGLQNGMATMWSGAIVRTTHVTGLVTDVGLLLGRIILTLIRKRCGTNLDLHEKVELADDASKLCILSSLCLTFLIGAFTGGFLEDWLKAKAFLVPAAILGIMGSWYSVYRVVILHNPFFSDAEMECVDLDLPDEEAKMLLEELQTGDHVANRVPDPSTGQMTTVTRDAFVDNREGLGPIAEEANCGDRQVSGRDDESDATLYYV